jgi:hypothetical protein
MRNRLAIVGLLFGLLAGAAVPALASHNDQSQDHNVPICHRGHTIHVNPSAVPAHLRHGDTEGPCQVVEPTATSTTVVEPPATDTPEPVATPTEPSEPEATATDTVEPEPTATDTVEPEPTATDTVEPTPTETPGAAGLRYRRGFGALRLW